MKVNQNAMLATMLHPAQRKLPVRGCVNREVAEILATNDVDIALGSVAAVLSPVTHCCGGLGGYITGTYHRYVTYPHAHSMQFDSNCLGLPAKSSVGKK